MSFCSLLRELGQLIQQRVVISCVSPRLVALDRVNELAGLLCDHPGLAASVADGFNNKEVGEAFHIAAIILRDYMQSVMRKKILAAALRSGGRCSSGTDAGRNQAALDRSI